MAEIHLCVIFIELGITMIAKCYRNHLKKFEVSLLKLSGFKLCV